MMLSLKHIPSASDAVYASFALILLIIGCMTSLLKPQIEFLDDNFDRGARHPCGSPCGGDHGGGGAVRGSRQAQAGRA